MTALESPRLTLEEARDLTEEVKADAAALWAKLLTLYEGDAHIALGYSSWGDYYAEEFGESKSRGYQLLEAARVDRVLADSKILERPANDHVAREMVPVLRREPQAVEEVWGEVVELHGPTPTAAQVREVVGTYDDVPRGAQPTRGQLSNQSGGTDEWATPQDFFDAVNAEFGFTLDVCALDSSAKCERYFTPETDGLAQEWTGVVWMNPPYGNEIVDWVRKAYESAQAGAVVACLVPARVDTGWWWDYCRYGEVRFLRGRLRFGDADTSAPFPSVLVVFGRGTSTTYWDWR